MDIIYGKNYEGYADPTAVTAMSLYERRKMEMNVGEVFDYTLKNGKDVKAIVIKPYRNYSLCVIGSDEHFGEDVVTIRGISYDMSRPRSFNDLADFAYRLTDKEMAEVRKAYAAVCGVTEKTVPVEKIVEVPVEKVVEKIVEKPVGDSEFWRGKCETLQEMNTTLLNMLCK